MINQAARFPCFFGVYFLTLGVTIAPATAAENEGLCPAQVKSEIAAIAQRPALNRARLGVAIQPLDPSHPPLYDRDAQQFFLPASNVKLLTTAAALTALGPQFQIQTQVYGTEAAPQLARLRIVGGGDPSFTDAQLIEIALHLQRQGVQHIQELIGDDRTFNGPSVVPTWEWEDLQAGYGAPVNSLILNRNAYVLKLWPQTQGQPLRVEWLSEVPDRPWRLLNRSQTVAPPSPESLEVVRTLNHSTLEIEIRGQLRSGAAPEEIDIAIVDPGWYLLRRFRQILANHQIQVDKLSLVRGPFASETAVQNRPPEHLWMTIKSPPLTDLITTINQQSNNLYAEALLQLLGTQGPPSADHSALTARAQGLAQLKQTLTQLGVDPTTYEIVDGSGLSRHNLVSPIALVQVLQGMAQSQHHQVFRASLPTAGVSGTLKHRFVDTPAQGILQAKTGTLSGVSTLSGYLNSSQFPPLVFSIMVNQYNQSGSDLTQTFDDLVAVMTRLRSC